MEKGYPEHIMKTLRKRAGLSAEDESLDKELNKLSPSEALNEVATWEGLLGYGDTIINWVQDIYGIEL